MLFRPTTSTQWFARDVVIAASLAILLMVVASAPVLLLAAAVVAAAHLAFTVWRMRPDARTVLFGLRELSDVEAHRQEEALRPEPGEPGLENRVLVAIATMATCVVVGVAFFG